MREGIRLGGRYRLDDWIATGGMGEVWRSHDETLGRAVAVKLLRAQYASDPAFVQRFRTEARNTAMLSHPGIATVYDYGEMTGRGEEAGGSAYLVMELVRGAPLSAVLARRGHLSVEETLDLVGQTAAALDAAHRAGVVHRDIKPGNLLVEGRGPHGAAVIKVTDFGIARATDAVPLTQSGTVLGTAWYLSPKQAAGEEASPAGDIYSLGVVAYECLAGRRPFDGPTPVAVLLAHQRDTVPPLPAALPRPVVELVLAMMARRPEDRPASAGELSRDAFRLREAVLAGRVGGGTAGTRAVGAGSATTLPLTETGGRTVVLPPGRGRALPPGRTPLPGRTPPPGRALPPGVPQGGDAYPADPVRRQHSLRVPLIGLGLLLALVAAAILSSRGFGRGASPSPSPLPSPSVSPQASRSGSFTTSPTSTTTTPPSVQVSAADYLDRPLSEVRSSLRAKGLSVSISGSQLRRATVVGISPTGSVAVGSTVTVTTTPPPTPPPNTPLTTPPTSPTPPPTPPPPPPPPTSPSSPSSASESESASSSSPSSPTPSNKGSGKPGKGSND